MARPLRTTCADCGVSDFETYQSVTTYCKPCWRARVKKRRWAKIEQVRNYDRERSKLPHRIAQHTSVTKQWRKKNPMRYMAHNLLNNAIRDGRVVPWPVCAIPDCCGKPVAHHPDYSAPLDVVWLCQVHHKQAHALVAQ